MFQVVWHVLKIQGFDTICHKADEFENLNIRGLMSIPAQEVRLDNILKSLLALLI